MTDKVFSPERLREAMGGMSNIDLAGKLGCARSSITMYLSGQRTPSKMTIQLMAICLGVSPAWLMGLDVPKYLEGPTLASKDGPSVKERLVYERLSKLTPENLDIALAQLDVLLKHQEKRDND